MSEADKQEPTGDANSAAQSEQQYGIEKEEDYGDEGSAADDDIFKNNHDLIGVEGILKAQKNEIEKKKLELRMENERYLRQH